MSTPSPKLPRLPIALMALGFILILFGVIYLLEAANGPGAGPTTFAERRSYNQVKVALHESLPLGGGIALSGLALIMYGNHLRERLLRDSAGESS